MNAVNKITITGINEFAFINEEGEDLEMEFWKWVKEMEESGELEEMRHRAKVLKDNQLNLSDYEVFLSDFEKVLDAAS